MNRRSFAAMTAGTALLTALAGCRVETVRTVNVRPRPPRIAGVWTWVNGRGRRQFVAIERTRGGILSNRRGSNETIVFERVGPGVFQDEGGRVYEFFNDNEAIFRRPNGRSFAMVRA